MSMTKEQYTHIIAVISSALTLHMQVQLSDNIVDVVNGVAESASQDLKTRMIYDIMTNVTTKMLAVAYLNCSMQGLIDGTPESFMETLRPHFLDAIAHATKVDDSAVDLLRSKTQGHA